MKKDKVEKAGNLFADLIPGVIKGAQIEILSTQRVTSLQFLALIAISYFRECKMSQLAKSMKMSYPQATGIVERLIKLSFLQRFHSKRDRRVVLISLTSKGKRIIKGFKEAVKLRWEQIVKTLEQNEIDTLIKLLEKFSEMVEKE